MNPEAALISAICKNKDIAKVLQANPDMLFVTHRDVWDELKRYYIRFKEVPSVDKLETQFRDFVEVEADGPTDYYLDQVTNQFRSTQMAALIRRTATLVNDGKNAEALATMSTESAKLARITSTVQDLDLSDVDSAVAYLHDRQHVDNFGGIQTGLLGFDTCLPAGLGPGMLTVLLAYPQIGKEVPLTTPIATPNGWSTMGELEVGSDVIARNGKSTKVTHIIDQGVQDEYVVTFNDGTSVITGAEHAWTVYTRDTWYNSKSTFVKETHELMADLYYHRNGDDKRKPLPKWFIPLVAPVEYSARAMEIDPYTLGALLGDGSLTYGSAILTNPDREIIERVPYEYVKYNLSDLSHCDTYSIKGISKKLKELGVCVLSGQKFVPQHYKFASVDQRLALLRGLMDTDGSCTNHGTATFATSSNQLAADVAELVRSLGGIARVHDYTRKSGKIDYVVRIMRLDMNPFLLKRKAEKYVNHPERGKAIVSIEKRGTTEMRCIIIEDSEHLFAVNDYIMTHNSWLALYIATQAWRQGKVPMVISLEMTEHEVRNRMYALLGDGKWSHRALSRGDVDIDDFKSWATDLFKNQPPIHIVSTDGLGIVTPDVVRGKVDQYKPDIVIVDYLQLMGANTPTESEVVRVKNISRDMKLLSLSQQVPVVLIASATPDDNTDMESPPELGQVAWSKQIAYDADVVLAMGREPSAPEMEVVFRKNRHGPMGDFVIECDFDRGRFRYVDDD